MCVAAPGRIVSTDGNMATIDYDGNTVKAHMGVVNASVGDYVLVHAGMIIQTIKSDEAEKMKELFDELKDL